MTNDQMEEKIGRKIGSSEKTILPIPANSEMVTEFVRVGNEWIVGRTFHRSFLNPNLQ